MFRCTLVFLFVIAAAIPVWSAQPMTESEQKALLDHLERTQNKFLESVSGLSEVQSAWKPAPDRWSVTECAEHIAVSEKFIRELIEPVMKERASEEMLAKDVRKETMLNAMIVDRSQKFKAPEPVQPTARYGDLGGALEEFRKERSKTIELAKNGGDLRLHAAEHPFAGALDAYSWIIFLSAHTERHTLQILEVKATEGFPKN
ncbi:MAG TPA: DinB family protein [Thermoanaerobaculia bacterium]|nr:DinB family protein [Thermoanaerobaculia bacterium]